MSLEISFSWFLCVSGSRIFGRGVSDFWFLANGLDQNYDKFVYAL